MISIRHMDQRMQNLRKEAQSLSKELNDAVYMDLSEPVSTVPLVRLQDDFRRVQNDLGRTKLATLRLLEAVVAVVDEWEKPREE